MAAATAAVIAAAAIGAGATAYGANKQSKAAKAAAAETNATNQAMTAETNKLNWSNYLMSRGIQPLGEVTPGVVPADGQYKSVNAKLPLWAKWSTAEGMKT